MPTLQHFRRTLCLISLPVIIQAQDIDPTSDTASQPHSATTVNGYSLRWSDEFNGTAINEEKWNFRTGDDNREFIKSYQHEANNEESDGLYRCLLKKETMGSKSYTAGGLITKKRFRYGYYESRLKVPASAGWHTSFWMMPKNGMGDPTSIELDVIENDSDNLELYHVNIHSWKPDPHETFGTFGVETPDLSAAFHTFGCEFTPEVVNYYFDGTLVQSTDATQFEHSDMNIWVTSLGLCYTGETIDDSALPTEAVYDYVRYFELGPHANPTIVSPTTEGTTIQSTNQTVVLKAEIATINSTETPDIQWTQTAGPGVATFENEGADTTGVSFSAEGLYELTCSAMLGGVTNSDTIIISVNTPVQTSFQHGVQGYDAPCTFIRADLPSRNSGADSEFIVGRWGGEALRGLLSFDLSSFDEHTRIQSATLELHNMNGSGTIQPLALHALTQAFTEGTGDGSSDESGFETGATWTQRTDTLNWATAGGDLLPTLLSSAPGYDTETEQTITFQSSASFVQVAQEAIENGALNLCVYSPETESGTASAISRIGSDDTSSTNLRPCLRVQYLGNFLPSLALTDHQVLITGQTLALTPDSSYATEWEWTHIDGPNPATFSAPNSADTEVRFPDSGTYQLRLTATNPYGSTYTDTQVAVIPEPNCTTTINPAGQLCMEINALSGLWYTVQNRTNLLTGKWVTHYTTNATTSPIQIQLPSTTNQTEFYRLQIQPEQQ